MKHPSYKDYFVAFRNIPLDELADTRKLRVHASGALDMINSLVENINDTESLLDILDNIARRHYVHHKITFTMFEVIYGSNRFCLVQKGKLCIINGATI